MITVFGKPLRGPSPLTRLVLLGLLSAGLMMFDHQGEQVGRIRAGLMVVLYPVQVVAGLPVMLYHGLVDVLTTDKDVKDENEHLEAERVQLLARLQQYESLEAENERLRAMLGAARRVSDRALTAEILEVSAEPFSRRLFIRRGSSDEVYVGQPVIDAYGIVGQVTKMVASYQSVITLITDPSHVIPVLNNRSGLRAMIFGSGDQDSLTVPYLSAVADIKEGDLLVSSGMGGTFPAGYPVAVVTKIENNPGESFLQVRARPAAQLNHGKQVLLIWPGQAAATKSKAP